MMLSGNSGCDNGKRGMVMTDKGKIPIGRFCIVYSGLHQRAAVVLKNKNSAFRKTKTTYPNNEAKPQSQITKQTDNQGSVTVAD
jgi:2,3-bisphosphoglycerate-independent phosphoglycerate mutase